MVDLQTELSGRMDVDEGDEDALDVELDFPVLCCGLFLEVLRAETKDPKTFVPHLFFPRAIGKEVANRVCVSVCRRSTTSSPSSRRSGLTSRWASLPFRPPARFSQTRIASQAARRSWTLSRRLRASSLGPALLLPPVRLISSPRASPLRILSKTDVSFDSRLTRLQTRRRHQGA